MATTLLALLSILLTLSRLTESAPQDALVTHLSGFNGSLPSKHYAGYVNLNGDRGKKLFYYFVESEGNPVKDPVVLWLNGGPGCSSFDGFVYEHGPFNFELGKQPGSLPHLNLNPYSWSKVSNIIYLDSPAGVGLSYSDNVQDYYTGDLQTAADSHNFLLKVSVHDYPILKCIHNIPGVITPAYSCICREEFLSNPFFIAGESYAGVYVPTLASEVTKGIESGLKPTLNFKGYIVGNGVTDPEFDGNALVPFAHGMGLISDTLYEEVKSACQGVYWNSDLVDQSCDEKLGKVDTELDGLNIYDILEPCYHSPSTSSILDDSKSRLPASFRELGETQRPLAVRKRMFGRSWPLRAPVKDGRVPTWPEIQLGRNEVPCTDDEVATAWLNDETVRSMIHAQPVKVAGPWDLCTGRISFNHNAGSMIKYHRNLTMKGYRALIFSGDHDMCVPFTGTEAWTRSMGYQIIDEWRAWSFDGQVAGYTQGYAHNLTFLTVKGSGHTVPEYKPREALAFYTRWLAGGPI